MIPSPLDRGFPSPERGSTLTAAIAAAGAGATIELEQGTYTGNFSISSKTNLTIKAKAGCHVVITSRDPRFLVPNSLFTAQGTPNVWTIAEVIGITVWRTNGRKVIFANDETHFGQLVAAGIQCCLREESSTRIYLEGNNPNNTPLYVSNGDGATLAFAGCTGLTLRGVSVFFGGAQCVNFDDGSPCDNVLVEECTILGGKDGFRNKNGAGSDITYRRNWIVSYNDPRWYYRDIKGNTAMEGSAIVSGGENQTAEENIIVGWHNGIGMSASADTVRPIIRRNAMIDLQDDAIELDLVVDFGTGCEITENLLLDGFVWISFSPRQFNVSEAIPVSFNTAMCQKAPSEDRNIGGSQVFGQGTKFNSHPSGSACEYVSLTFNTVFSYNDTFRMAPSSQDTYPSNITATDNIICALVGPVVRNTGSATAGNSFQRNCYYRVSGSEFSRNFAVDFTGGSVSYNSLALAKAGPEVTAAGWEVEGIEANPRFLIDGQPGSLKASSTAHGKGAWLRSRRFRVDSVTVLATGWILIRGDGFTSDGAGLNLVDPIMVSMTTAFGRTFRSLPGGGHRPW